VQPVPGDPNGLVAEAEQLGIAVAIVTERHPALVELPTVQLDHEPLRHEQRVDLEAVQGDERFCRRQTVSPAESSERVLELRAGRLRRIAEQARDRRLVEPAFQQRSLDHPPELLARQP